MLERKFEIFDPATAELMRAAYHDVCSALRDCNDQEREAVANCIIELVRKGERNRRSLAQAALARLYPDKHG